MFNSWPFASSVKLSDKRIDTISFLQFSIATVMCTFLIGMFDRQYLFFNNKNNLDLPVERISLCYAWKEAKVMTEKYFSMTEERCLINLCKKGTNRCCTDYLSLWMSYFFCFFF